MVPIMTRLPIALMCPTTVLIGNPSIDFLKANQSTPRQSVFQNYATLTEQDPAFDAPPHDHNHDAPMEENTDNPETEEYPDEPMSDRQEHDLNAFQAPNSGYPPIQGNRYPSNTTQVLCPRGAGQLG